MYFDLTVDRQVVNMSQEVLDHRGCLCYKQVFALHHDPTIDILSNILMRGAIGPEERPLCVAVTSIRQEVSDLLHQAL